MELSVFSVCFLVLGLVRRTCRRRRRPFVKVGCPFRNGLLSTLTPASLQRLNSLWAISNLPQTYIDPQAMVMIYTTCACLSPRSVS